MKKFLLMPILVACVFFTQAQTAKPTKKQTFKFIKDFFKDYESTYKSSGCTLIDKGREKTKYWEFYVVEMNLEITEDSCKIVFYIDSWVEYSTFRDALSGKNPAIYEFQRQKGKYVIDFSKVESQTLVTNTQNYETNNLNEASILFKSVSPSIEMYVVKTNDQKKDPEDMKLPDIPSFTKELRLNVGYACGANYDLSKAFEKLVKAFNHFRKLCGAPEPIEFD